MLPREQSEQLPSHFLWVKYQKYQGPWGLIYWNIKWNIQCLLDVGRFRTSGEWGKLGKGTRQGSGRTLVVQLWAVSWVLESGFCLFGILCWVGITKIIEEKANGLVNAHIWRHTEPYVRTFKNGVREQRPQGPNFVSLFCTCPGGRMDRIVLSLLSSNKSKLCVVERIHMPLSVPLWQVFSILKMSFSSRWIQQDRKSVHIMQKTYNLWNVPLRYAEDWGQE